MFEQKHSPSLPLLGRGISAGEHFPEAKETVPHRLSAAGLLRRAALPVLYLLCPHWLHTGH